MEIPTDSQNDVHLLSQADLTHFHALRQSFANSRDKKNKSGLSAFQNVLIQVRGFIWRTQQDVGIRAFVCGMWFHNDVIALNVGRFASLVSSSKSTVNGHLKGLGYGIIFPSTDDATAAAASMKDQLGPSLAKLFDENFPRHWRFRKVRWLVPPLPGPAGVVAPDPECGGDIGGLWTLP
jgi:hypothetical protein